MDSVVLKLCHDSLWKTLKDGRMEYVNVFFVKKNIVQNYTTKRKASALQEMLKYVFFE